MFSGLPCESHIAHMARIARTRGTVRVRRLGGIEARPRHLPGIGALPSPRQGIPRKKIQGLPPSILLSPQDCLLRSCCHPRIEGNSTRNSTRATPKKWDMPVSSSELHAGSNQKNGWCLFPVPRHFESTSATCAFEHHIPARHRSLPAAPPARHEPCRAQGRDSSQEKNVEVVV